jgi:hypothetical protein
MKKTILNRELSPEEREELLEKFSLSSDKDVIYNDDGERFYDNPKNRKYNFNTLDGFFDYAVIEAIREGRNDLRRELRELMSGKDGDSTFNKIVKS